MLGRDHWGQWTMGPRKTLTLHKLGQVILDLAETPPYSTARFTFILNILVPSSQNYENMKNYVFHIFGGWFFLMDRPETSRIFVLSPWD